MEDDPREFLENYDTYVTKVQELIKMRESKELLVHIEGLRIKRLTASAEVMEDYFD